MSQEAVLPLSETPQSLKLSFHAKDSMLRSRMMPLLSSARQCAVGIPAGECSVSFYGYMVETERGHPRLWSFRLSDSAKSIKEYKRELIVDQQRRGLDTAKQQTQMALLADTAKILFSDMSTSETAATSLLMQPWCPFQNPADLHRKFDELLPAGQTGMAFVSYLHDMQGILAKKGLLQRELIKTFVDISAEPSRPKFCLYDKDIIPKMALAYLPGFLEQGLPDKQYLVEPAFWRGWKDFRLCVRDNQGREAVILLGPLEAPRRTCDVQIFSHGGQEVARYIAMASLRLMLKYSNSIQGQNIGFVGIANCIACASFAVALCPDRAIP